MAGEKDLPYMQIPTSPQKWLGRGTYMKLPTPPPKRFSYQMWRCAASQPEPLLPIGVPTSLRKATLASQRTLAGLHWLLGWSLGSCVDVTFHFEIMVQAWWGRFGKKGRRGSLVPRVGGGFHWLPDIILQDKINWRHINFFFGDSHWSLNFWKRSRKKLKTCYFPLWRFAAEDNGSCPLAPNTQRSDPLNINPYLDFTQCQYQYQLNPKIIFGFHPISISVSI